MFKLKTTRALLAALPLLLATPISQAEEAAPAAAPSPPKVAEPAKMSVDDIRACMRSNFVDRGSLRDIELAATDREGKTQKLKLKLFWKPAKDGAARMNLRVTEPADLKGSSYLLVEDKAGEQVHVFLPALGKPQQVSGEEMSKPLWGTDFSYAEIKQVQGFLQAGETQRQADAKVAGRAAFVLDTATSSDATGYTQVVSYVDQASCTLLKSEFFAKPGKPRKVLEGDVSTLLSADAYWILQSYTMRDLRNETRTRISLSDFYLFEQLSEKRFKPETFFKSED